MNEELILLAHNFVNMMKEIDPSQSLYRKLAPGEQDQPPTGDDFNKLWKAIIGEFWVIGIDLEGMLVDEFVHNKTENSKT